MLPTDLSSVLARYAAHLRPQTDPEPLTGRGGLSGASLWRYEAEIGPLVARAWPKGGPGRERLEAIHGWLSLASGLAYIPVPLPALDGRTLQEQGGRLWEVSPWQTGMPDLARPPSPSHVRAAFEAVASLHLRLSALGQEGLSPGLRLRTAEVERLIHGEFDTLAEHLAQATGDPARQPALRWLALARIEATPLLPRIRDAACLKVLLQPCLRDARPEHFLFDGDRLTGLVDFGAMDVECVAADLARLLGEWLPDEAQPELRSAALAAYELVRPLHPLERALIAAFEAAADLLIAAHWIRWHFVEKREFDDSGTARQGISRGLERLERLSRRSSRALLNE